MNDQYTPPCTSNSENAPSVGALCAYPGSMAAAQSTKVMVFSNQPIFGHGIGWLLQQRSGTTFSGTISSCSSLREAVRTELPDILLVDLNPEVTVSMLAQLRDIHPACKQFVLGSKLSPEMNYQLRRIGVVGFLQRDCSLDELTAAIDNTLAGAAGLSFPGGDDETDGQVVNLSRREGQFVTLLSQGLKNKEIAHCLGISEGTVKVYLSKLFRKFGVNDRFELALFGLRNSANLPSIWPRSPEELSGSGAASEPVAAVRSLWLRPYRARRIAGTDARPGEWRC